MHKHPPVVFVIFFNSMILRADVLLIKKAQHSLFELSASLAWDDLDKSDFFVHRIGDDAIQFGVDTLAVIVNIMKVKDEFCHVDQK